MKVLLNIFAIIISLCAVVSDGHAIPIDTFKTKQYASVNSASPEYSSSVKSKGSIGGFRSLNSQITSGQSIEVFSDDGLSITAPSGSKGTVTILWDNIPSISRADRKANYISFYINKFDYSEHNAAAIEIELIGRNQKNFYSKLSLDRSYDHENISLPLHSFGLKELSEIIIRISINSAALQIGSIQLTDSAVPAKAKISRANNDDQKFFKVIAVDKKTKGQIKGAKITFVSFSGSFKAKTDKYGEAIKFFEPGAKVALAFSHKSYGSITTKVYALKKDKTLRMKRKWNGKGKQAKFIPPDQPVPTATPGGSGFTPPPDFTPPPGFTFPPAGTATPDRTTTPNIFSTLTPTPSTSGSATNTPLVSLTATRTPLISNTPTRTPLTSSTATRTNVPIYTLTHTATPTITQTPSNTPTITNTPTPTIPSLYFTTQPSPQTPNVGQSVSLSCVAGGGQGAITYQWYKNDVAISGAIQSTYTFTANTSSSGTYYCMAINGPRTRQSNSVAVNVRSAPVIDYFNHAGKSELIVNEKTNITLNMRAYGYPNPHIEFQKNNVRISTLNNQYFVQPTDHLAVIRGVAENSVGVATTNNVTLKVITYPTFTTQPVNRSVRAGSKASFSCVATSTFPITSYRWESSLTGSSYSPISGATSSTYTTPNTTISDNNKLFRCYVANAGFPNVPSSVAKLTVTP